MGYSRFQQGRKQQEHLWQVDMKVVLNRTRYTEQREREREKEKFGSFASLFGLQVCCVCEELKGFFIV